jgi:hypothetical protein
MLLLGFKPLGETSTGNTSTDPIGSPHSQSNTKIYADYTVTPRKWILKGDSIFHFAAEKSLIGSKTQGPGLNLARAINTGHIIELIFEEEDGTHES